MAQRSGSIALLVLILPFMAYSSEIQGAAEAPTYFRSSSSEVKGVSEAPPYFGEPMWQDSGYLFSFTFGVICVYAFEQLQGRRFVHRNANMMKFSLHACFL
mmetsp:Transcript_61784/g.133893  ORF Transcript_61784/g.133893 Transcript_61784/m.133893 type:complete len:101 (+) Transcript_61784:157-459(+)